MSDVQEAPEWIGSLPRHWRLTPVGSLFDERKESVSDSEFPALSVTKGGVVPQLSDVAKSQNGDARKLVRAGDFVINSRSDRKGSSGISELDGSVSVVYTVLRLREGLDLNFAHHLLRSSAFQEEFYRWGSGIVADLWSTRYSAMKRIALPIPPLDEQRAIADYLDRETQKIDELITEQRGLIEILRERWTAISEKYFGKYVMGSSRLRWLLEDIDQRAGENSGELPLFSVSIDWGVRRRSGDVKQAEGDLTRYKVARRGDVVLNRMRAFQGALGVAPDDGLVSPDYSVLRTANALNSEWLSQVMRSPAFVGQMVSRIRGIGGVTSGAVRTPRLNFTDLREIPIDIPDLDLQSRDLTAMSHEASRIDELISESEDLIAISQERRAALITAAVTGQIDVRTAA